MDPHPTGWAKLQRKTPHPSGSMFVALTPRAICERSMAWLRLLDCTVGAVAARIVPSSCTLAALSTQKIVLPPVGVWVRTGTVRCVSELVLTAHAGGGGGRNA